MARLKIRSNLKNEEVAKICKLLGQNADLDADKKLVTYHAGWSDDRILKILREIPGRNSVQVSSVIRLRRKEFGYLQSELKSVTHPGNFSGSKIKALAERVDALERQVAELQNAVTTPAAGIHSSGNGVHASGTITKLF